MSYKVLLWLKVLKVERMTSRLKRKNVAKSTGGAASFWLVGGGFQNFRDLQLFYRQWHMGIAIFSYLVTVSLKKTVQEVDSTLI